MDGSVSEASQSSLPQPKRQCCGFCFNPNLGYSVVVIKIYWLSELCPDSTYHVYIVMR